MSARHQQLKRRRYWANNALKRFDMFMARKECVRRVVTNVRPGLYMEVQTHQFGGMKLFQTVFSGPTIPIHHPLLLTT